jgi:hypothetical protein
MYGSIDTSFWKPGTFYYTSPSHVSGLDPVSATVRQTLSSEKVTLRSPSPEPSFQSGDFLTRSLVMGLSQLNSPPGYREPDEGESTLSVVLDSLSLLYVIRNLL